MAKVHVLIVSVELVSKSPLVFGQLRQYRVIYLAVTILYNLVAFRCICAATGNKIRLTYLQIANTETNPLFGEDLLKVGVKMFRAEQRWFCCSIKSPLTPSL